MKRLFLFFIFCCGTSIIHAQDTLRLKTMFQPEYHKSFELSGLAQSPNQEVFMVNDENKRIYQLKGKKIIPTQLTKDFDIRFADNDWEGIDFQDDKILILSENSHSIIGKDMKLTPDFAEYEIRTAQRLCPEKWGNAGFEGFCHGDTTFFLAKERSAGNLNDGRYILEINKKGKILRKFSIPKIEKIQDKSPDFADIKYARKGQEEYIYLLERNYYCVTRLNLKTLDFKRVSFAKYTTNPQLHNTLYESPNPQYGMAEALLLTHDEIWIGFDNNERDVNTAHPYAKKYQLQGNQCVLMKFERGDL